MQQTHGPDIVEENQNALQTLTRAIRLSEGQFSLILAYCNYGQVRQKIAEKLRLESKLDIEDVYLPANAKMLYTPIKNSLKEQTPEALMVFGLEEVTALDELLISTNLVRNEFPQNFPFSLVLWVNDAVLQKLIRLAPDFETYGSAFEFSLTTEELIDFIRQSTEKVFRGVLDAGAEQFLQNSTILGVPCASELEFAAKDLQSRGVKLDAVLEASLLFLLGRKSYILQEIETAKEHYLESIKFWQQAVNEEVGDRGVAGQLSLKLRLILKRQGIVLFHTGLCYRRFAEKNRLKSREYLEQARNYLQQCLDIFEQAERPDLVGKFIPHLGEILQHLQAWEDLQILAIKSQKIHEIHDQFFGLAQDYGFLSAVALQQGKWKKAEEKAIQALSILGKVDTTETPSALQPQQKGLYLLLKGKAQHKLGESWQAIDNLESAHLETDPQYDPRLYLEILQELHDVYFALGHYQAAFDRKQESRTIEAQYGLRAFMGAGRLEPHRQVIDPALELVKDSKNVKNSDNFSSHQAIEITATGRVEDLNKLLNRCLTPKDKLIVIYGQSGVGKSSLVMAGLVPALQQKNAGTREVLPVVVQVYNDFFVEIYRRLIAELQSRRNNIIESVGVGEITGNNIISQLKKNTENNLLTVLIFDQFEEFFFVWKDRYKKQAFFEFLKNCLNEPFVKVIFSFREDYLYLLLEATRQTSLDAINNDILSKDILFYLGNFSPENTYKIIKNLTKRAQFELEDSLVSELVRDLAGNAEEVRPIELQVVGAQLQAENITTLAEYQQKGPKEKLVERFLEQVIWDCGPENERAARLVLYFLTDENDTRPLKTRAELATDLARYQEDDKLELVLDILVKSGLVFRIKEMPAELFQLVHDYLVTFIRQQQEITPLEAEKLRRENVELRQKQELSEKLIKAEEKEKNMKSRLNKFYLGVLVLAFFGLAGIGALAWQARSARQQAEIAEIKARNSESKALRVSNDQLGGLIASVKAGNKLQNTDAKNNSDIKIQTEEKLQQAISSVQERNRLEGHMGSVLDVSFSPNGKTLASASADKTVKLWTKDGKELQKISSDKAITRVSFSPLGTAVATAENTVIKIWKYNQKEARILTEESQKLLKGHEDFVTRINWSNNGQLIASASADYTIKLWTKEGKEIRTIKGHKDWVLDVVFSEDGQKLASASLDGTVKIWNLSGTVLATLKAPEGAGFTTLSFSPDGSFLVAAATTDKVAEESPETTTKQAIMLWQLDKTGKKLPVLVKTLQQSDKVLALSFSPTKPILASAGEDGTVKLWNKDGQLLEILEGHTDRIWGVKFSPDGKSLATASEDKSVKIWALDGEMTDIFTGHTNRVNNVSFSPDGKTIISASADKTVKLWNREGRVIKTLTGHKDWVSSVSLSHDGQRVASAGAGAEDKTIILWNFEGKRLAILNGHQNWVTSLSWSPDDQIIASGSNDKTIKIWSRGGSLLKTLTGHKDRITAVAFSPDGKIIASASYDKTIKLWSRDGRLLKTLNGHTEAVNSISWSPDGKMIASAGDDKTIKFWNWAENRVTNLSSENGHTARINSVNFSPDGKLLASASDDKTIKLWRVSDKRQLQTFLEHNDRITSISFSPDSKWLASGGADSKVIVWRLELDINQLLGLSCNWLKDYLSNNPKVKDDRQICDDIPSEN
ncbi:MAG TPA: hypothetical protein V6D13_13130 [Halomicronema sp.]